MKMVVYEHNCMDSARYHLRKYKHWAKLLTNVDETKSNGFAFQGEWLQVTSQNLVPNGSLVVEFCGYDGKEFKLYRVTETGKEEIATAERGKLVEFVQIAAEEIEKGIENQEEEVEEIEEEQEVEEEKIEEAERVETSKTEEQKETKENQKEEEEEMVEERKNMIMGNEVTENKNIEEEKEMKRQTWKEFLESCDVSAWKWSSLDRLDVVDETEDEYIVRLSLADIIDDPFLKIEETENGETMINWGEDWVIITDFDENHDVFVKIYKAPDLAAIWGYTCDGNLYVDEYEK